MSVGYTTSQHTAVIGLTFGVGMTGLVWSGLGVNMIEIAPRYAGLLMGISNCIATLPGIVGPLIAGALTPNEVGSIQIFCFVNINFYIAPLGNKISLESIGDVTTLVCFSQPHA